LTDNWLKHNKLSLSKLQQNLLLADYKTKNTSGL